MSQALDNSPPNTTMDPDPQNPAQTTMVLPTTPPGIQVTTVAIETDGIITATAPGITETTWPAMRGVLEEPELSVGDLLELSEDEGQSKMRVRSRRQSISLNADTSWTQVFNLLDLQGRGVVNQGDMERGFERLRVDLPPAAEMVKMFARAQGQQMTKPQFVAVLAGPSLGLALKFTLRQLILQARMYKEMFSCFDRDNGGTIGPDELGQTITRMFGWRPTRFQSHKLLSAVDPDGDGSVNLAEFVLMMNQEIKNKALEKIKNAIFELHHLFELFDINSTRISPEVVISEGQLGKVITCLGWDPAELDLGSMLAELDSDGDGLIDLNEFLAAGGTQAEFEKIDVDGSGTICQSEMEGTNTMHCSLDFVAFADMMTVRPETRLCRIVLARVEELRNFFSLLDIDDSGSLTLGEMSLVMRKLGRRPTDGELVEAMGHACDPSKPVQDIELDFGGFVRFMAGTQSKAQRVLQRQLREYREAFDLFDEDGGGDVTVSEFAHRMQQFGEIHIDMEQIGSAIMEHDLTNDGVIDFIDFLAMMMTENELIQRDVRAHLVGFREAFNLFDSGDPDESDGLITTDEFLETWRRLGFVTPESEVRALLEYQDADGDGELGFQEFVEMLVSSGKNDVEEKAPATAPEDLVKPLGTLCRVGSFLQDAQSKKPVSDVAEQIRETLQELRHVWSILDPDGDGSISPEEVVEALAEHITDKEYSVEDLTTKLLAVDDDGSGELNFMEFAQLLCTNRVKPGMLVKKAPPTVQQTKDLNRTAVNWDRFETIIETQPDNRTVDMCKELAGYLRKLGVSELDNASDEVLTAMGQHIVLVEAEPEEAIFKEGELAQQALLIMSGTVDSWRWKKKQDDEVALLLSGVKPALWRLLQNELDSLLEELKFGRECMPTGELSQWFSPEVKLMMSVLNDVVTQTRRWYVAVHELASHDLEDVIQKNPSTLLEGREVLKELKKLQANVDTVHSQQLLQKFYVQLCVAPYIAAERIEEPYGPREVADFIETLEENKRSFVVVDGLDPETPVLSCSDAFVKLTGYSKEEIVGQNCRMLQCKETDKTKLQDVRAFIDQSTADTPLEPKVSVLVNARKNGGVFHNLLTLHAVPQQGHAVNEEATDGIKFIDQSKEVDSKPKLQRTNSLSGDTVPGQVLMDKWIGVQVDVTEITDEYAMRSAVAAILDVCKMLLETLDRSIGFLGPCFGRSKWEARPCPQATLGDELCGVIGPWQLVCDLALKRGESTIPAKCPMTCTAGSRGVKYLRLSRMAWLQVHSLEPVQFLQSMGFGQGFGENRLHRLATYMSERAIPFNSTLLKDTDSADNVYLVKSGQLKIQEVIRDVEESMVQGVASTVKITRTPIALVGQGDALDECVFYPELDGNVYGIDAVANTDNTVVYELSRAAIEKVTDGLSSWAKNIQEKTITKTRSQHRHKFVGNIGKVRKEAGDTEKLRKERKKLMEGGGNSLGNSWSSDYRIDPRNTNVVNDFKEQQQLNIPDAPETSDLVKDLDHSLSANGREYQRERTHSIKIFRQNRKLRRLEFNQTKEVARLSCQLVGLTDNPTPRSRSALQSLHHSAAAALHGAASVSKPRGAHTPQLKSRQFAATTTALPHWSEPSKLPKIQQMVKWKDCSGWKTQVSMMKLVDKTGGRSRSNSGAAPKSFSKTGRLGDKLAADRSGAKSVDHLNSEVKLLRSRNFDWITNRDLGPAPRTPINLKRQRARLDSRGRSLGPRHLMMQGSPTRAGSTNMHTRTNFTPPNSPGNYGIQQY